MKSAVIALFLGATSAVKMGDAPPYFNEPTWTERMPSAGGFLQVNACVNAGVAGVTCAREVCSGTNGPVDGPSGTPCTRDQPDDIPHYNTDTTAGRPYQTSGDITATSPEATSAHSWPASQTLVELPPVEDEAEKVSVLQTPYGHTHTSFY